MDLHGHGGTLAVAAATAWGVEEMFTLSGAHVFPLYDAAVGGKEGAAAGGGPLRLIDVRHEQSAVFAAEAIAKLTRRPGLAVVTAGPGVTNSISAVTTAHANGSPLVLIGGRAPGNRWGTGALQELDHPPLLAHVTKAASTVQTTAAIAGAVHDAFSLACSPHRGPVFLDIGMDVLYSYADAVLPERVQPPRNEPDLDEVAKVVRLLGAATRPVLVIGGDVWMDGADAEAAVFAETAGIPVIANGMGRGILPPGHHLAATRARSTAFKEADLVIVVGTPLDFRLGYGVFGAAAVVHITDSRERVATHSSLAAEIGADLSDTLEAIRVGWELLDETPTYIDWSTQLGLRAMGARDADAATLASDADPIHPARIYGELMHRLTADTVVVGDGGDFVSFAGRYVEPQLPGNWLDPGPYGCLGIAMGYTAAARLARPTSPVVTLLGDGAAGFSLMDIDTLVRHQLPAVIVIGNNGIWGLEKHPMQFLYSYDVAAELQPGTRYDEVARALGADGEYVTTPAEIGPALDRALAANAPYVVNIATDPGIAYPRSTTGV